mmetsp:Transcript_28563/g.56141  ORF Transcript_28563/g.56141 Transcript_28563/m.56141 type:complete len:391 (-) Transcript_28563:282-1454(-)
MPAVLPPSVVAVTGANGYIGSHVVGQLLEDGYQVIPVVRNPSDPNKTNHLHEVAKGKSGVLLPARNGNLLQEGSFDTAFQGVDAVIHTAAIVQMFPKKDGVKEIIDPSHKGTKNVLDSVAKNPSVKRIIHTSSVAAIQRYDRPSSYVFTEKDEATWSSVQNGDFYGVAKLGAEHMVLNHCKGKDYDAVVINPALVLGPSLCKEHTKASAVFVRQMLFGNKQPDAWVTSVDVRDVARAHVAALANEAASGQRFVVAEDSSSMRLSSLAKRVQEVCPTDRVFVDAFISPWQVTMARLAPSLALLILAAGLSFFKVGPSWAPAAAVLIAVGAFFKFRGSLFARLILPSQISFNAEKSRKVLGIKYHTLNDTLKDTVDTMRPFVKIKSRNNKKD